MSDCKIYPADTVDIYGNVWETVGENIRNGLFGKLKIAKIKIDANNITSRDATISDIKEHSFGINKKGVIILFDNVYKGAFYLNLARSKSKSFIVSNIPFSDIKADISLLYTV